MGMSSYIGRDEKKLAVPRNRYLSREEILSHALNGRLTEDKLREAAPMAYNFPSCKFRRARMVKSPFLQRMEEKYKEWEIDSEYLKAPFTGQTIPQELEFKRQHGA